MCNVCIYKYIFIVFYLTPRVEDADRAHVMPLPGYRSTSGSVWGLELIYTHTRDDTAVYGRF